MTEYSVNFVLSLDASAAVYDVYLVVFLLCIQMTTFLVLQLSVFDSWTIFLSSDLIFELEMTEFSVILVFT